MKLFLIIGFAFLFSVPMAANAVDSREPLVRLWKSAEKGKSITQLHEYYAFAPSDHTGGTVAVCDLNNDGVDEIVVGAGQGARPDIIIFKANGEVINRFVAFPETFTYGLHVACGNLDGGGNGNIVVGMGRSGGPQVTIFDIDGNKTGIFAAFDEGFRGGVTVAMGNVDGKKGDEIIAGAGPGAGAHVRVFNERGEYTGIDFSPFGDFAGGVSVAAANVDGGDREEVVIGQYVSGGLVKVYKSNKEKTIVGEFQPYGDDFAGGITVASAQDVDNDGVDEILTIPRQGGSPHLLVLEGHGTIVNSATSAYESDYRGGVSVASGNVDGGKSIEFVTIPQKKFSDGRTDLGERYIDVDLSEQKLTAYKNGVKEFDFLISSGVAQFPSPEGITQISAKLPVHDYQWTYGGALASESYDIKDVHNNLRFRDHYYVHEAYWHNNFGTPMSHGCINASGSDSARVYNWANVGDRVWVHQ